MKSFKHGLPPGFTGPTALPADVSQQEAWQQHNRDWWQHHPMRYDRRDPITQPEFSKEFYDEIDRRFFNSVWRYAPWKSLPFDFLVDFSALKTMDVLEIGCGSGSHGQLLATHTKSYTGIDITDYAVKSTSTRMSHWELNGKVLKMDAEQMHFLDNSFDLIWSWGVIHHSANTLEILREMNRVLRPGGRAIVMVYYRGMWGYYAAGVLCAILRGQFPTPKAIHEAIQFSTDGGLARYYRAREWRRLVSGLFNVKSIQIYGEKDALILLPGGKLKELVLRVIPDSLGRFLITTCRMGRFLVSEIEKS